MSNSFTYNQGDTLPYIVLEANFGRLEELRLCVDFNVSSVEKKPVVQSANSVRFEWSRGELNVPVGEYHGFICTKYSINRKWPVTIIVRPNKDNDNALDKAISIMMEND